MSFDIKRVNDATFSINFKDQKHKPLLINITKTGFDSKIDENNEFFYHLVKDVAQNIFDSKEKAAAFNKTIKVGERDWVISLKQKTDSVVSKILPVFHHQADDNVVRLEIAMADDFNPLTLLLPGMNVLKMTDNVKDSNRYNDTQLYEFNVQKSILQNKEDCKLNPEMIPCSVNEIREGVRGKFAYKPPIFREAIKRSPLSRPFTVLSTLAFQRYEKEFTGHDEFKAGRCNYCLVLENGELKLSPQTKSIVENHKSNRNTIREYKKLMTMEFGEEKLAYACKLAKLDLDKLFDKGAPLTPEHVYRINILTHNVETQDLSDFLEKLRSFDLEAMQPKSTTEMIKLLQSFHEHPFTAQEVRGMLKIVQNEKGDVAPQSIQSWIQEIRKAEGLNDLKPNQIDQLAKIFFPSEGDWDKVFTGRGIYYPIKSGYTTAETHELKPWIDQQELLHTFSVISKTKDWDLYHEKLSHVICKKHLFRAHPTKQYTTGALIPAPLDDKGQPRWLKVDQANYNGYGMLNYTLKPVGDDSSLPLIKLYRSTSSDPYAVLGQKTIRTDLNPLNLPGYEGIGKTDLYENEDFRENSIPVWVGYVLSANSALENGKDVKDVYAILSKANAELHKYESDKAKVYSFPEILKRHDGIINNLFVKGRIDLILYNHLKDEYLLKSSFREDKQKFQDQVKKDSEELITRLANIKFDLSSFSKSLQPQIATEIDILINELNTHLLIVEAEKARSSKIIELEHKILNEAILRQNIVEEAIQEKDFPKALSQIRIWKDLLNTFASEAGESPEMKQQRSIHFVGHSLGGGYAQIYTMHYLTQKNRIPSPGCDCVTSAFDASGVTRQDNELFKKFILDHESILNDNSVKFIVKHQHEAGDPVHTVGVHLGSAKSEGESKEMQRALHFQANVMARNPNANHPTLANAITVHATQFLEGKEGVDFQRRAVTPYEMGLMESYEKVSLTSDPEAASKGEALRRDVWKFPLPLSTSTIETIRTMPTNYWIAGQLFTNWVEGESEMIPFLDPMGNFSANEKGLNYLEKEFYTSTVPPSERPSWIQKLSEEKLIEKFYPGANPKNIMKIMVGELDKNTSAENIKKLEKVLSDARRQMELIGGERITIRTSAGNLDAMLLRPDRMSEKLARANVQSVRMCVGNQESTLWKFDKKSPDQMIVKAALENMRFLKVGLNSIESPDAIYVGDATFIAASEKAMIDGTGFEVLDSSSPKTKRSEKGVLICGGNLSVYEMFTAEVSSFLLRGMNVMLFNPPGFGASEGKPNEETITEGILAAYDTFTRKARLKEKDVLIKSLCMSGGWATKLAKSHPETALWLDQTYSSFYPLVQTSILKVIKGKVPEQLEGTIANLIPRICVPAFDIASNLSEHKGWKCIMYSDHDEIIPASHVLQNIDAIEDSKPTKVIEMPGKHCQTWYRVKDPTKAEAYTQLVKEQVDTFLARAQLINPLFVVTTHENIFPKAKKTGPSIEEVSDDESEEETEAVFQAPLVEEYNSDEENEIQKPPQVIFEEVESDSEA